MGFGTPILTVNTLSIKLDGIAPFISPVLSESLTDTEIPAQEPEPRKVGRPRGEMSQRIVALLSEHPEGLSAEEIRVYLKPENPLGDTLQSLRTREKVRTQGKGKDIRYFVK